jgi:ATP-binding cassette, subfamily B, bacterial
MLTDDRSTPFEPVGVVAEARAPAAAIGPPTRSDGASAGWLRRMAPIALARRGRLVVGLVTALLAMAASMLIPRTIMSAIDRVIGNRGIGPALAALGVLAVIRAAFTFVYRSTLFGLAYDLEYDLRTTMHAHFMRLGLPFFDKVQAGQLISRANSDIRSVQMFLTFAPLITVNLFSLVIGLALMASIHLGLTIAALCTIPFTFIAGRRLKALTFPLSWIALGRSAEVATVVDENVQGVRVVRSFAAEQREIDALAKASRRLEWAQVQSIDANARWGPIIENLPRLGLATVLLYGGHLAIDGRISVGALVAFNSYVVLVQQPFRMLPMVMMMAQRSAASAERIYEVLDEQPAIAEHPGAHDLIAPTGDVRFDNVRFAYPGSDAIVLDGLCLHIRAGETVAIVGRTASGKSSIARLLARFYDVTDGSVQVDGRDVSELTLGSLRHAVTVVSDEPFLFSDTIRSNIDFGRPGAPLEDVVAAARDAQAEEFIEYLADGYNAVVGERGYDLSGGQRQRIALARALLADSPVLVLDDATSAIDSAVESQIHDALRHRRAVRTTIVIAHRLSSISLADRVLLLEGGRIVADGAHEHLLANEPRYAAVLTLEDADVDDGGER